MHCYPPSTELGVCKRVGFPPQQLSLTYNLATLGSLLFTILYYLFNQNYTTSFIYLSGSQKYISRIIHDISRTLILLNESETLDLVITTLKLLL